ncbi:MAG: twin-arginine translocase TatA/TatE family subunit [Chloroflexi bacterium]|nr:twin-arginine translocase TatA/TatE family subunit [Chloroflexota bacterium]
MRILGLGLPELLIILLIILLIFGVGRISKIAGELGSGIRAFRDGLKADETAGTGESEDEDVNAES